jgi:dolichol-phosphate mannosyltransferase
MRSLVIVPTFNERESLPLLVPAVLCQGGDFEVLVVDDNSPDGTGALADAMAAADPRVHVLHRVGKLGLGTAYIAGFRFALDRGYDAVFEMDADFSHDPSDLPRLLAAVDHADVAIGSRWVAGGGTVDWSLLRRLISRGGSLYAGVILGLPIRDLTSGFKCFRRDVLASLDLESVRSNGYGFQVEMNYLCHRAGFRLAEVPIIFADRRVGSSKMSSGIVLEAAARVCQLRLRGAPTRQMTAADRQPVPAPVVAPSTQGMTAPSGAAGDAGRLVPTLDTVASPGGAVQIETQRD